MRRPPLRGTLLQSREEWATRNTILAHTLSRLICRHLRLSTGRALDVGCQAGTLTDMLAAGTSMAWLGIDPGIAQPRLSPRGLTLLHGWAHELPFPDAHFDCVVLANVYEHIRPELREPSLSEILRVLSVDGVLVGQLPNPYFPIESHSRLPFMGWLPYRLQKAYWRLAPVHWEHDFYVVTVKHLRVRAERVGFTTLAIHNFNYPAEVIPSRLRSIARLLERPMRIFPWAWQFAFRKQ